MNILMSIEYQWSYLQNHIWIFLKIRKIVNETLKNVKLMKDSQITVTNFIKMCGQNYDKGWTECALVTTLMNIILQFKGEVEIKVDNHTDTSALVSKLIFSNQLATSWTSPIHFSLNIMYILHLWLPIHRSYYLDDLGNDHFFFFSY